MSTASQNLPVTCSATRAFKSIFNSPNWTSNLLWLTIAALLQSFVVGTIFLFGYGSSVLKARAGLPDRNSPDIDSNRLSDYFMQGLWPFLVYFVSSMVVSMVIMVPLMIFLAILMAIASQLGDVGGLLVMVIMIPMSLIVSIPMAILLGPITIRAMICQDFQKSFDTKWCTSFIKLTYREVITSTVVFMVLGMATYMVGFAFFCVGIFPAIGILTGAFMHLLAQWYELFLSRGGEPVPPGPDSVVEASVI